MSSDVADESRPVADAGLGVMPPSPAAVPSGGPLAPEAPAGASQTAEAAHKANVAEIQQRIAAQKKLEAQDVKDAQAATHALKTALGNEFAPALRVLRSQFNELPESVRERLLHAEDANGRLRMNDPLMMQRALQEIIDSKATGQNLHEELESLRKIMREDRRRWNKDEALQMRYRQLIRGG